MTIIFKNKNKVFASQEEQRFIRNLLTNLHDKHNGYTIINLIYNNALHNGTNKATSLFDICTLEELYNISRIANSDNETIYVEGNIHSNNHISNIIINPFNPQQNMFVEDKYIRIRINNIDAPVKHILTDSPLIQTSDINLQYLTPIVMINPQCDKSDFFIGPLVQFIQ